LGAATQAASDFWIHDALLSFAYDHLSRTARSDFSHCGIASSRSVVDRKDEAANSEELLSPDESETLEMFRERLLRSANGVAAEKSPAGTALPPSQERAGLAGDRKDETRADPKR
jgi:hypothetical protein